MSELLGGLSELAKFLGEGHVASFLAVIFILLCVLPWIVVIYFGRANVALASELRELHREHVGDVKLALEKVAESQEASVTVAKVIEGFSTAVKRTRGSG